MNIIGIETSARTGSVALLSESATDERFFTKGLRHGRELIPTIDAVTSQAGLAPGDIDLFAVSQGPGSYTGIRVGVATAKTLAYALGKKLVGVPSLDVIAQNAPGWAERVYVILDAKRRRVYFCSFRRENGELVRDTDYLAKPIDEALSMIEPGGVILGDAVKLFAAEFEARGARLTDEELWLPKASNVARLGKKKLETDGPDDPFSLVPIYLHRPEAEEVWEKRHGGK